MNDGCQVMAKTMSGLNWIYKENNEPLRWLRGFGMNLINENSMFKSIDPIQSTHGFCHQLIVQSSGSGIFS
jgi:2-polyprenyl-6-methoxyphenol hydroxylase-like FAD-dependent oxidoreductase